MDDELKLLLWGMFLLICVGIHIALTIGVVISIVRVFSMYLKFSDPGPALFETLKALAMALGLYVMSRELPSALAAYVGIKHEP